MYCSDETPKDHANENISRSEKALTKTASLQTQRFDELKPTPQEGPVNIQQDQVLPGDSLIWAKTIPESSSPKSIISNVEIQQLSSPSGKPHERMTDSCKISLPDPTVLTEVGNILVTRNQSQDLEVHEDQKLSNNSLLTGTPPEKSSWSEDIDVQQSPFGRLSKKNATKVHKDFTMPTTPTYSDVTDMTLSRDQHVSVEPNQNLSDSPLVYKKQCETSLFSKADAQGGSVTESSDSFRKSSKSIISGSHEESDLTTVTKTLDIYLNQSQILLDQAQTRQSPKFSTKVSTSAAERTEKLKPCFEEPGISTTCIERISVPKCTDVPVLTGRINPQLAKAELEAEGKDTTKSSNESFMRAFTLKGKGEFCNETTENLLISLDDNNQTPHEDSLEAQQDQELPSNTLAFEFSSERVAKAIVRGVDIQQKSISSRKPSERITDPLQMTLPDPTLYTKDKDTLLTVDQPQGLEVQQDQMLPSDSLIFETPFEKSSIVRGVDIRKPLTLSHRSSKNIAIDTHEDVSFPKVTALTHVTGILSAQDQAQLVEEVNQDQSLQHFLSADVKGDKAQSIMIGSHDEDPLSGPSTTKFPTFSAESTAIKPVLDKTAISICTRSKKMVSLPTSPDNALVQSENTKCQMTEAQIEAGDIDGTKSSDNVVTKTSLQTQVLIDHKHILHEYLLEGQHDQNLPSNAARFEFTPERTSVTSVELQRRSIVSHQPSVRLTCSPEITLPDSHIVSHVVSESSEFTKKPSLQTQRFGYHKHTGHDYPLKNEQDQQQPSNAPFLELTDEIPSGIQSESDVIGVDVQQKSAPSGKPSEKNEGYFEVTSPDSTVHTMATGITLSRDQHILEKPPSDSLLFEKTLEKSSVIWTKSDVSESEIQQPSMSSQKPNESIIDHHKVRFQNSILLTEDLSRDQSHVPLEDKQVQILPSDIFVSETMMYDGSSLMGSQSVEVQQPSALSEGTSSHKEATLPDSTISQNKKESMECTILSQDMQIKYPYPAVTLYPGTSPDFPEISDTSSKSLQSTNTVQCTVQSPTILLTSPSAEGEEPASEESSVSQCQPVTQRLNNFNVKTNEVAKLVCCINPQTLSNAVWYHNDKRLATTERIKFEQSGSILSLLICDIQPEDQGIYSCVVINKDGKTQRTSAHLNIEGGYLPCHLPIPNHHSKNIHIIPCHFVIMSNLSLMIFLSLTLTPLCIHLDFYSRFKCVYSRLQNHRLPFLS